MVVKMDNEILMLSIQAEENEMAYMRWRIEEEQRKQDEEEDGYVEV